MRRLLLTSIFLLLFITRSLSSFATHIFGGDLLYMHETGNTYSVKLTLYGDCSAKAEVFNSLYVGTPIIYILNNGVYTGDSVILIAETGTGIEVSPVCPSEIENTSCNNGSLPGVRKFVYTGSYTLPSASKWEFVFNGNLDTMASGAGRSSAITNINDPGMSIMQIEADLNNVPGANSSPDYTTIPTPFYCVGVDEEYNPGATDPDGDSLVFSLVPAINGNTGGPVSYISPYTATAPLSTAPGNFTFNPTNGQISFTADILQHSLIVNTVSEYRHGVLVGTSQREMTFIFLDDCTAPPPVATVTAVSGTTYSGTDGSFNICEGTPSLSFTLSAAESSGDSIFVTSTNVPASASLTISNNNTPNPIINFSWNTSALTAGFYTFYLTYLDNHCPISNKQTLAYTIAVIAPYTIIEKTLSVTQCVHQAAVEYNMTSGLLPRTVTVSEGGTVLKTFTDTTGKIADSLYAGNYVVTVSYRALCAVSYDFTVIDSGVLPTPPADTAFLCVGNLSQPLTVPTINNEGTITWYDDGGNPLSSPPEPPTNLVTSYTYLFTETYKNCTSDTSSFTATIHPLPTITAEIAPDTICYGDIIYLTAYGGATYTWSPANLVDSDKNTNTYTHVFETETFTVTGTDQNGCSDTASVTFSNIQPCCKLSYPTAFTPNDDGINDGFRVVTYGNMAHYSLTIYNRWGQQVFFTEDPKHAWTGNYGGVACETGVYYYIVKATCVTGHSEMHKGDITLVR